MNGQPNSAVLEGIRGAAMNSELVSLRDELATFTARVFLEAGKLFEVDGALLGRDRIEGTSPFGNGSDKVAGVALLLQIASQIISGSTMLFGSGQCYAAAALVRQIVEIEYLAWAFANRDKDAQLWLRSTKRERENFFAPRKIREAANGKFGSKDYGYHCDLGGHPTPLARSLLNDNGTQAQLLLSDLLHHARGVWIHLMEWAEAAGCGQVVVAYNRDMLERYLRWAKVDPLGVLPEAL